MDRFEAFREALALALPHLYDPSFHFPGLLYEVLGYDRVEGAGVLQRRIIGSIEEMMPGTGVPVRSRARRYFVALHGRFVEGLTLEETAERLHLSVRHLQRVQAEATHVLAAKLWERRSAAEQQAVQVSGDVPAQAEGASRAQATDWHSQAGRELASLMAGRPDALADVGEVVRAAVELGDFITARHGIRLELRSLQPNLIAMVHPVALRQTLITAIGWLSQLMSSGRMAIYARLQDGKVRITITGPVDPGRATSAEAPIDHIIAPPGAAVEFRQKGGQAFIWVTAASAEERTVLVVEDNPDMVHFYRRCTAKTPYRIVHTRPVRSIVDEVEAAAPDIVVLDVMLPDVDGWELLTRLREHPATRSIPVIVCSVVKEDELALALGAACFLAKPVQPQQFVEALDQVLGQASTSTPTSPVSSAEA